MGVLGFEEAEADAESSCKVSGFPQAVSADIRGLTVQKTGLPTLQFITATVTSSLGSSARLANLVSARALSHNVYEGQSLPLSASSSTS